MKKIAIATDSNSGITQAEGKENGIFVLPMPFTIGEEEYFEDINLSQDEFYEKLKNNEDVKTSQPALGALEDFWDNILKDYDEIVYIPMSSGLSKSCESAINFAREEKFAGKVFVVDNQRISVTLKNAVYDAKKLAEQGKDAEEIKQILTDTKFDSSIYIMVDTLKYLKKGGRITPAGAALGALLHIKPVLQIQGGKLDAYKKVMGTKVACQTMIEAVKTDLNNRFKDIKQEMRLCIAHTHNDENAQKFMEEVKKAIPDVEVTYCDPLSLSVSCHIGPGALAVALYRELV